MNSAMELALLYGTIAVVLAPCWLLVACLIRRYLRERRATQAIRRTQGEWWRDHLR
jgi:hypothetical protein